MNLTSLEYSPKSRFCEYCNEFYLPILEVLSRYFSMRVWCILSTIT